MSSRWPPIVAREEEGGAWDGPGLAVVRVISTHMHWPELSDVVILNLKKKKKKSLEIEHSGQSYLTAN